MEKVSKGYFKFLPPTFQQLRPVVFRKANPPLIWDPWHPFWCNGLCPCHLSDLDCDPCPETINPMNSFGKSQNILILLTTCILNSDNHNWLNTVWQWFLISKIATKVDIHQLHTISELAATPGGGYITFVSWYNKANIRKAWLGLLSPHVRTFLIAADSWNIEAQSISSSKIYRKLNVSYLHYS